MVPKLQLGNKQTNLIRLKEVLENYKVTYRLIKTIKSLYIPLVLDTILV